MTQNQPPSVSANQAEQLANQAFDAFAMGQIDQADQQARALLQLAPFHPTGVYIQALVCDARGNLAKAERLLDQVVARKVNLPRLAFNHGVVKLRLSKFAEAEVSFLKAAKAEPKYMGIWSNLGVAQKRQAKYREAEKSLTKATRLDPKNPGCLNNLGSLYLDMGEMAKAEGIFRKALELAPDQVDALDNLCRILETPERRPEAIPFLERLIRALPTEMMIRARLGACYLASGQEEQASRYFDEARQLAEGKTDLLNKLGLYHRALGRVPDALRILNAAVLADDGSATAHNSLGATFHENGRMDLALPHYEKALICDPNNVHIMNNLGNFYKGMGRIADSFEQYRKAVAIKPDFEAAWRNLMGASLYHAPLSEADRFQFRLDFVAACAPKVEGAFYQKASIKRDPDRALRIGVLSGDLRDHPISRNLGPFFAGRDRDKFKVFCYGQSRRADAMTETIKGQVDGFRSVDSLSDSQLAKVIAEDKIDVLLSIAGYFDENRPLVACYKPAPVIISYHDGSTSALDGVDYIISDRFLTPPGGTEKFTERVIRIPSFYMHAPLDKAPIIGPCPSEKNGYVTFGSCNNPAKIGDAVLDVWGELLASMPQSRLLLKYRLAFKEPLLRDRILSVMSRHGVGAHRLVFSDAALQHESHLAVYNHIDIALDPFPFGGSTTTFESLWMGVPVVTLAGTNMMARMPISILKTVGVDGLIADNLDQYFFIIRDLADDEGRRADYRATLRDQVRRSPICDPAKKARYLERLIRAVWHRWVAGQKA